MRDETDPAYLRELAAKCRRLANGISDSFTVTALKTMAHDYEARASTLETKQLDGVIQPKLSPPKIQ